MGEVQEDWSLGEPPEYAENDPIDSGAENIAVTNLDIDVRQSRTYITDFPVTPKDEQLIESVAANGLFAPLVVRPIECVEYEYDTGADYVVVAGSRRLRAVEELGWEYANCKVVELTDEEAVRVSLHENLGREDLTDYMTVKHIGGWYGLLAEDLIGEDDDVECPKCGKECSGRLGLSQHVGRSHENEVNFTRFLSPQEIHRKIATEVYGDEVQWQTVENIVSVASLPDEAMALIKTEDELEPEDRDLLENYGLTPDDTPNASVGDGVATVLVELARLARKLPGLPGSRVVKAYAKHGNDIPSLRKRVNRWQEHEGEDFGLEAFDKALKGQEPPEPEEEQEDEDDSGESEGEEEESEGNGDEEDNESDEDEGEDEEDEEDDDGNGNGDDEDERNATTSQKASDGSQEGENEEDGGKTPQQSKSAKNESGPFSITVTFHGKQEERIRELSQEERMSFIADLNDAADEILEGY